MNNGKLISLTVTDTCNLRCDYCYQSHDAHRSKNHMSFETAKNILLKYFSDPEGYKSIEIDFFGGEPFVNKDVIVKLVEWTISKDFQLPYIFFASTNGTLIKGKLKDWLIKHKDIFILGLSLDGTPQTHNKNRDNSYEQIDLDFFLKTYPKQPARMTVSANMINNLYNDIVHMHELGFLVDAAYDQDFKCDSKTIDTLSKQLKKLCDYYIANPDIEPCSLLNRPFPDLAEAKKKVKKWCGAGTNMVSIDVAGNEYPCQAFQPNTIEDKISTVDISKIKISNSGSSLRDLDCKNCIIEPICPTCYGMNLLRDGDISSRNKEMCSIQKTTALAVSYLRGQIIANNQIELDPPQLLNTIKSIKLIQEVFS